MVRVCWRSGCWLNAYAISMRFLHITRAVHPFIYPAFAAIQYSSEVPSDRTDTCRYDIRQWGVTSRSGTPKHHGAAVALAFPLTLSLNRQQQQQQQPTQQHDDDDATQAENPDVAMQIMRTVLLHTATVRNTLERFVGVRACV